MFCSCSVLPIRFFPFIFFSFWILFLLLFFSVHFSITSKYKFLVLISVYTFCCFGLPTGCRAIGVVVVGRQSPFLIVSHRASRSILWKWRFYEGISEWTEADRTHHGAAPCITCVKAKNKEERKLFHFPKARVTRNLDGAANKEEVQTAGGKMIVYSSEEKHTFPHQWMLSRTF